MDKLKITAYTGYLACALCFGKSAESLLVATPLINDESTKSLDLVVSCLDYNSLGSIIARGQNQAYANKSEARFNEGTNNLVKEINSIRSSSDYKRQANEEKKKALKCWGYQLAGLFMAGIGGYFNTISYKNRLKRRRFI